MLEDWKVAQPLWQTVYQLLKKLNIIAIWSSHIIQEKKKSMSVQKLAHEIIPVGLFLIALTRNIPIAHQ